MQILANIVLGAGGNNSTVTGRCKRPFFESIRILHSFTSNQLAGRRALNVPVGIPGPVRSVNHGMENNAFTECGWLNREQTP